MASCCLDFLNDGLLARSLNKTNICLIPKCKEPKSMTDLWSISLSNAIYKIVAKVLANRLKGILPRIISLIQSAFVQCHNYF